MTAGGTDTGRLSYAQGMDGQSPVETQPATYRGTALRVGAVLLVIALLISVIAGNAKAKNEPPAPPARGEAPGGYAEYEAAVDVEFSQAMAAQLSVLGDDPATGNRSAGSPAESEAATLIEQTMKDIGLQNVTVDHANSDGWTFKGGSLDFVDAQGETYHAVLGGYQTEIYAENEPVPVVYLGEGTAADYVGIDVRDKLVLIDVNQDEDWWINYPALQAKLKGARAVLAMSVMEKRDGDRIGSQDICGPPDAPVLAISQDDSQALRNAIEARGYESGGTRQLNVNFNANSDIRPNAGTQNVWGEIPGQTDETILFIAHYDGYYHAFYDDASGIGLILGMAKSFVESAYEPRKTLRFIAHGAEEWGRIDTEADWAIGAYEQIVNVHPDWAESAFALINIDAGYPLENMHSFDISAPYEIQQFASNSIVSFGDRTQIKIKLSENLPDTYREDFIYNAMGVPTLASEGGEGEARYLAAMYHSNKDLLEEGGYSMAGAEAIELYFGYATLMLDQMPLRPMHFEARFTALKESYGENNAKGSLIDYHLLANTERAVSAAQALDQMISRYNAEYRMALHDGEKETADALMSDAAAINTKLYNAYRMIQNELLKLSWQMEPQFPNEGLQYDITKIGTAIAALKSGKAVEAIEDSLSVIKFAGMATVFDKETCDYFVKRMQTALEGTWAERRLVSGTCYVDDVVRSLSGKIAAGDTDYAAEIDALETLKNDQEKQLSRVYSEMSDGLARLTNAMNAPVDLYQERTSS